MMKRIGSILAFAGWALGLGACITATTPPQPPPEPPVGVAPAQPPATTPLPATPAPGNPGENKPEGPQRACHLPSPKKSDDSCKTDADCGPSDPCHARACVARARSKPRTPDVMCTMMLGCETADANRCGCFEGRCSLIPPDDAAKE